MATQHPIEAFMGAVGAALLGQTVAGQNVWAGYIPSGTGRPYCLLTVIFGSDRQHWREVRDPEIVIQCKWVADTATAAATGAQQGATLLDRKGRSDIVALYLDTNEWHILITRKERDIHLSYPVENGRRYEVGFELRTKMHEK